MSDVNEANSLLRSQLREKEADAASWRQKFEASRTRHRTIQEKYDNLLKEHENLRSQHQTLLEAAPDLEYLEKTIDEWKPIVEAAEAMESEYNSVVAERDEVTQALNALTDEYTQLKNLYEETEARIALPPDEANARIRDLEAQIARRDHERAFLAAVRELKDEQNHPVTLNDGVTIDDVWSRVGYVPEGQPPEATTALEQLRQARAKARFLFQAASNGSSGSAGNAPAVLPREPVPPGPGAPRGTPMTQSGVLNVGPIVNKPGVISTADSIAIAEAAAGKTLRMAPIQPPGQPRRR